MKHRRSLLRITGNCLALVVLVGVLLAPPAVAQAVQWTVDWPIVRGKSTANVPRVVLNGSPAVRIGDGGQRGVLLSGVVGAVRLRDGRIAVADASENRIVFFDSTGKVLKTFGRRGKGPGEFQIMRWFGRCANEKLAVQDAAMGHLSLFNQDGDSVTLLPIPSGANFDRVLACSGSVEITMLYNRHAMVFGDNGYGEAPTAVVRLSPNRVDTIATGRGHEYFRSEAHAAFFVVPLGKATLAGVGPSYTYVCDNVEGNCKVFNSSGRLRHDFDVGLTARQLDKGDWEQAISLEIASEPLLATRKVVTPVVKLIKARRVFPKLDRIAVDASNQLWIRTFDNFQSPFATWIVLDTAGSIVAMVATPRRFDPLDIGKGYLLGVERDTDDVETVNLYRLPATFRKS